MRDKINLSQHSTKKGCPTHHNDAQDNVAAWGSSLSKRNQFTSSMTWKGPEVDGRPLLQIIRFANNQLHRLENIHQLVEVEQTNAPRRFISLGPRHVDGSNFSVRRWIGSAYKPSGSVRSCRFFFIAAAERRQPRLLLLAAEANHGEFLENCDSLKMSDMEYSNWRCFSCNVVRNTFV